MEHNGKASQVFRHKVLQETTVCGFLSPFDYSVRLTAAPISVLGFSMPIVSLYHFPENRKPKTENFLKLIKSALRKGEIFSN
jgi:hypothetical protein